MIFPKMMNQRVFQELLRHGRALMFMLVSAILLLAVSSGQAAFAQKSGDTPEQPPVEELPDFDGAGTVSIAVPTTITAGSRVTATVTMQNTGTTTWSGAVTNPYMLGSQNPTDNQTWGLGRVELAGPVPPGANAPFTFTITAPSTPGTYSFSWAMLREGYAWFGYTASATINVVAPDPVYDAQLVSANVPSQMAPGGNYNLSLTFKNTGNVTWTQPDYRLANLDDSYTWGLNRVDMSTPSVAPGQSATFNFQVRAPATAGTYPMQWGMVWEYHRRFGQYGSSNVSVTQAAPANAVTYIHTDALGSPVARTDASGRVISRTRYEPYGYVALGAQPTIGFTGHVNDVDTGLTYMQQRYYDPVAGRFLSIDPVVTDANTGGSFNRFSYANNNPYKYIDPDGRNWALASRGAALGAEGGFVACGPWCSAAGAVIVGGAALYGSEKVLNWIASSGEKRDTLQPGPYAGDSIPARGPDRDFTREERNKINEIGSKTGCHTCGSKDPGTKSGDHVLDHQPANALNPSGGAQRLYPHCLTCSRIQGGQVRAGQSRKPPPEPKPEKKLQAN
jgi:RHS repeat-associated protein